MVAWAFEEEWNVAGVTRAKKVWSDEIASMAII
jgi:hypothetical protein